MRAHAIVIGIDSYTNPAWNLTGAVRDAVAFARWAITAGGVDPQNLILLLSPLSDGPPLTELLKADQGAPDMSAQAKAATRASIDDALYAYRKGAAKDADRLWFYYAGHGLAAPSQAPDAGPIIVPTDIENIERYVETNPIGLEIFRGWMENSKPKEQFFFIDACRDVLPTSDSKVLSQQLLWDVRSVDDDQLAIQNVFLATTAGQRAKEIYGHGLFGRALLAALRGLGPELRPPIAPPVAGQLVFRRLLFNDLVRFVSDAVKRAQKDLLGVQQGDLKGVPYARVNRLGGDIVLTEFRADSLPTASLGALVEPENARQFARIEFIHWDDDRGAWTPRTMNPAPMGPPVPEVATFQVRGGSHHLRITADGFEDENREILVYEDKRFPIELRPRSEGERA
ncbi:MAG TPA: caspase family protein, partial [Pyrinomonadaceae bacterium]|nr:caspase family protein [Pyrinomonadaceae bacterium]